MYKVPLGFFFSLLVQLICSVDLAETALLTFFFSFSFLFLTFCRFFFIFVSSRHRRFYPPIARLEPFYLSANMYVPDRCCITIQLYGVLEEYIQ